MEKKIGSSWMNEGEISGVVNLVRHYYQKEDFVIITPYDPQRSAIIKALKAEGLPADKVFNVDSFQGNEAEYVLISVVRTENVGFLKSLRRMNVMLTRCKKGMVIVSSQRFLETVGHRTLLGRLAQTWENRASNKGKTCWVTSNEVMNQAVHLPGALGRNGHILRPPANKLTQQIINSGSTPPQTGSFIPMSMLPLADTKTNKQKVKRKVNAVPKSSTKGTKPVVTEDTGSKRDKPKNKKKKGKAGKGKAATLTA
ncbi:hypothetical protein K435DRAFT_911892 [Dendrothele bispora CBS 962.96]|uniref:DNA2/NAM7 helicase-like C-terminal domain-containing protein n=1 Tax=Dendrothele bispora (strain CBS 962.96) TaxID=1314807 RepID=A0A4S8MLD2_DENBC|nr:hypothetical protein K435DRAFT_911892 [Dendrothele bispora CBS 962.96]